MTAGRDAAAGRESAIGRGVADRGRRQLQLRELGGGDGWRQREYTYVYS